MRFLATDVLANLEGVAWAIREALDRASPPP
jgi:hypothetical protein